MPPRERIKRIKGGDIGRRLRLTLPTDSVEWPLASRGDMANAATPRLVTYLGTSKIYISRPGLDNKRGAEPQPGQRSPYHRVGNMGSRSLGTAWGETKKAMDFKAFNVSYVGL